MKRSQTAGLTLIRHPLAQHSLTYLRDRHTQPEAYRQHARSIANVLLTEATRDLELSSIEIETPLAKCPAEVLKRRVVIVPILRAGLALLSAADPLPNLQVGFVGLERDEASAEARAYYQKFPRDLGDARVFVLDPMLATGGSMVDAIRKLKANGATRISAVCVLVSRDGLARLQEEHPDVPVIAAARDDVLNTNKFIVPGLGDFGDRYFGTL